MTPDNGLGLLHAVGLWCSLLSILLTISCAQPSAVGDFAKAGAQAAQAFPAIASMEYDACVSVQHYNQFDNAMHPGAIAQLGPAFEFDQSAIDRACSPELAVQKRLQVVYNVLWSYMSTLGKLAGNDTPSYDKTLTTLPGLSGTEQTSAASLVSVMTDAFEKGWRQRQMAKAIERAQTPVVALTNAMTSDLSNVISLSLDNESQALSSLYGDIQRSQPPTNAVVLGKVLSADKDAIAKDRATLEAFITLIDKIREAHTQLYNNRDKLFDKKTIEQLFQTVSGIPKAATAVQAAAASKGTAKKI